MWSHMPIYCRYYHAEGHAVSDCPKEYSLHACWKCSVSGHIVAECTKNKNKSFKKARKTHAVPQDRVDNDEAQQNSPSTDTMFMVSPSTVPNIMKCKHSLQNESDGNPRSYSTILVTTEEISVLVSTQEVLAALFLSNVNSQDDVQIDTGSLKIENIHESRESTLVNQEINNVSQIKQQDINNRALTESHSGYKFRRHTISNCKSSSPDYVPSDQQHGITVFNFNCVPTPSQQ